MHISSNTTIYQVVCCLLYAKHNYMFRPQMLAIFRLYNENLSICRTPSQQTPGHLPRQQRSSLKITPTHSRTHNAQPRSKDLQSRLGLPEKKRSNADYGQYFHFSAFVDIYRRDNGQWTQGPTMYNRKLYIYPVDSQNLCSGMRLLSSCLLKIHFCNIFSSKLLSSKWYLSLRFPHQNPLCTSPLPLYVPHAPHS